MNIALVSRPVSSFRKVAGMTNFWRHRRFPERPSPSIPSLVGPLFIGYDNCISDRVRNMLSDHSSTDHWMNYLERMERIKEEGDACFESMSWTHISIDHLVSQWNSQALYTNYWQQSESAHMIKWMTFHLDYERKKVKHLYASKLRALRERFEDQFEFESERSKTIDLYLRAKKMFAQLRGKVRAISKTISGVNETDKRTIHRKKTKILFTKSDDEDIQK